MAPGVKTTRIAYQLPISTLLAGCQRAPHLGQVNEIRCKCRYNGAFCRVQITVSTSLPTRRICHPPNEGQILKGVCIHVWVCVVVIMCVCVQARVRVMRQSGDFPDSFAQWKPSCLPVYLFALLIADHISYATSPRIPQVNSSLAQCRRSAVQYGRGKISVHAGTRTSKHNHTISTHA